MKKTILSTLIFILFLISLIIFYLSFFGYETNKFNDVIKTEIEKANKNVKLDFEKIIFSLDLKNFVLLVSFVNSNLNYEEIPIPLKSLKTGIDLESFTQKKIVIEKVILSTEYLDLNSIKPLIKKTEIKEENLKKIKSATFQIKDLELKFDKNLKLDKDFAIVGDIKNANITISNEYDLKNLTGNYVYKKDFFGLNEASWSFKDKKDNNREFWGGEFILETKNKNYDVDFRFKTNNQLIIPKISLMNYSFSKENVLEIRTKFSLNNDNTTFFQKIIIEDNNNIFELKDLHLDKNYNLISFQEIKVKTSIDSTTNNDFIVKNKDKIYIKGEIFDAKSLINELRKGNKKNLFLKKISKDLEIDFNKVSKVAKFPIKNFRLIGKINKGSLENISAKSDFSNNQHLDISLKKQKNSQTQKLEIHSDIALPLINDYKFFNGLDGGNLIYTSIFDKKNSFNNLTINNFKLNDAPVLAKLLTLADLKGLTDTLKGEGISFDTLTIKYDTDPETMTINEIFMIGPSISILIDGYVEKKSGLISLRGTLVPAKTLNNLVSKIPVVGEILVGKKVGEGVFGLSFKIKGLPDDYKTTINPIKTIAPRFITRAVEAAKKRKSK